MKIFFDTGVFIALFIKEEQRHKEVTKQYNTYKQIFTQFYTSLYILDELYTRLLYDFGERVAKEKVRFMQKVISKKEFLVLDIDEAIFEKSQNVFLKFAEHKLSFTDATTYVLIKDFKLDEVFTLDSGFKKIRLPTSF